MHIFVLNLNRSQQAFLPQHHRVKGLITRARGNKLSILVLSQIKREYRPWFPAHVKLYSLQPEFLKSSEDRLPQRNMRWSTTHAQRHISVSFLLYVWLFCVCVCTVRCSGLAITHDQQLPCSLQAVGIYSATRQKRARS